MVGKRRRTGEATRVTFTLEPSERQTLERYAFLKGKKSMADGLRILLQKTAEFMDRDDRRQQKRRSEPAPEPPEEEPEEEPKPKPIDKTKPWTDERGDLHMPGGDVIPASVRDAQEAGDAWMNVDDEPALPDDELEVEDFED